MKDFGPDDPSRHNANESEGQQGNGATGIFGSIAESSAKPASSAPVFPEPPEAVVPEAPKTPVPNVHEVVFHAPGSGGAGYTDPLHRILNSPPLQSALVAEPAASAAATGGTPGAEANYAFTQMLRALGTQGENPQATPPLTGAEARRSEALGQPASSPAGAGPSSGTAAPSDAPGGGGFTALFGTIQAEKAPALAVAGAEAPAPGSRSFTQLFAALSPAPSVPTAYVPPTPVAAPAQPVSQAPSQEPVAPAPAAPAAGGFTQLFQALESKPVMSAPAGSAFPAAVAPIAPPAAQAPSGSPQAAGGITQLLRAIDMAAVREPVAPVSPKPIAPPIASSYGNEGGSGSTTAQFESASLNAPLMKPGLGGGGSAASEATAQFRTDPVGRPAVTQPVAASVPVFSSPAPPTVPAPPAPPTVPASFGAGESVGGGSFTQLFQTLDAPRAPQPAPLPPQPAFLSPQPAPPAPPEPAANAFPSAPPAAPQSPGSFTQMFTASSFRSPQEASQADAFPPIAPPSASRGGYPGDAGGVGAGGGRYEGGTPYGEPSSRSPEPGPGSGGGGLGAGSLTQLLRTLDSGGAAPAARPQSAPPPAAPVYPTASPVYPAASTGYPQEPMPGSAAGAGATVAFRMPQEQGPAPFPPPSPSAPSGPGEFTRILQASAFRESSMPAPGGGVAPPAAPAASAPPVAAAPLGFPPVPAWHMPPLPPAGGGGGFAMPGVHMPPLPAAPTPPAMPAPPKSSALVPILLVVLIVLVVALLLAVVLLMKH